MLQTQHECIELNPSTLMVHLNNKIEKVQKNKVNQFTFRMFSLSFFYLISLFHTKQQSNNL